MSAVADRLRTARGLYEANPTHAEWIANSEPGSHCAMSAIFHQSKQHDPIGNAALRSLERVMGADVVDFNTNNSTADVLAAYDRAIAAESE